MGSKQSTTKKVMVVGFGTPHLVEVAKRLHDKGIDIAYWTASKQYFKEVQEDVRFQNTIFHDGYDAIQGLPAKDFDTTDFEELDKVFLHEMMQCESQVLAMMTCVDYTGLSLYEKKHIFYTYLKYWRGVLQAINPDTILFHDIPHVPHALVIYRLAQRLNIKTVMQTPVRVIQDHLLFVEDFEMHTEIKDEYDRCMKQDISLDDLGHLFREAYLRLTDKTFDPTPPYSSKKMMKKVSSAMNVMPNISSLLSHVTKRNVIRVSMNYIKMLNTEYRLPSLDGLSYSRFGLYRAYRRWKKTRDMFRFEYEKNMVEFDKEKKYVYVPLHVQPERSTSAEGDVFADQLLMIDLLSRALPDGWLMYVKEQPGQWILPRTHLGRYKGYYDAIVSHENVRIVPATTSSFNLIEHAQAVATVTGTAAWEAVLRKKPALLFGTVWFMHCEGIFRVSNVSQIREAFTAVLEGYRPAEEKILKFLKALENVSVKGHFRRDHNKERDIPFDENVSSVTKSYYCAIMSEH